MMPEEDATKHAPPAATAEPELTDESVPEPGGAMVPVEETAEEKAEAPVPMQLGATRYVLAGFFAAGIAVAFLVGKMLNGTWNRLADTHFVAKNMPILTRLAEEDRPTYTTLVGAVVGIVAAVYAYRRPDVRTWTSDVAAELAKVSWPSKKEVTNSTMVVIVASAFATVFLALLDRFWGFVTNLVYGS
jgi:preprotein translocase subunit SecE